MVGPALQDDRHVRVLCQAAPVASVTELRAGSPVPGWIAVAPRQVGAPIQEFPLERWARDPVQSVVSRRSIRLVR
jgi:hypothetical protein